MKADVIPENDWISARIERAYRHMLASRKREWALAWSDVFLTYVRARNSMRTPAEVRELERARGLR